jgi:hypothetical protein
MPEAKRTLVKSGPELWAELTDPGALAGHLAAFGAVRITRTTPETLVEWEGDLASGTVRLEPAGFGTRVVLTSEAARAAPPDPPRASLWNRLLHRREPGAPAGDAEGVLTACLDALGSARHRPFSRA